MEQPTQENFEFVKKFSYRTYRGPRTSRFQRIISLAVFEMTNTWKKSTIGKLILGFVLFSNVLVVLLVVPTLRTDLNGIINSDKREFVLGSIFISAIGFFSLNPNNPIVPSDKLIISYSFNMGIVIIALFAIAGSGFFADDKQGKVLEIYLSRMKRDDYVIGKILGMFLYCNLFITLPFMVISIWTVQGLGQSHIAFLMTYVGLILAGALISFIFTIYILFLSSLVEKRAYASLSFFIGYILFDTLSEGLYLSNPSNELLLLVSPSYLLSLLIYILGGKLNLGLKEGDIFNISKINPLILNDGIGLEWWHVLGVTSFVIIIGLVLLLFKIKRITADEL